MVEIVPATAVITSAKEVQVISGKASAPRGVDLVMWLCPTCGCPGGSNNAAMVELLRIAGARTARQSGLHADQCTTCLQRFLMPAADVVLHLGDTEDDISMRRRDCPVCGHVLIDQVDEHLAMRLNLTGARMVFDLLDLIPEEADALTDRTVDLHEHLAVALGTPAPPHD